MMKARCADVPCERINILAQCGDDEPRTLRHKAWVQEAQPLLHAEYLEYNLRLKMGLGATMNAEEQSSWK